MFNHDLILMRTNKHVQLKPLQGRISTGVLVIHRVHLKKKKKQPCQLTGLRDL